MATSGHPKIRLCYGSTGTYRLEFRSGIPVKTDGDISIDDGPASCGALQTRAPWEVIASATMIRAPSISVENNSFMEMASAGPMPMRTLLNLSVRLTYRTELSAYESCDPFGEVDDGFPVFKVVSDHEGNSVVYIASGRKGVEMDSVGYMYQADAPCELLPFKSVTISNFGEYVPTWTRQYAPSPTMELALRVKPTDTVGMYETTD